MKQLVINKYKEVLMVMGNTLQTMTTLGVYKNVQAALDGMSKLYKDTVWEERTKAVKIYGILTEDNGYQHTANEPIYTTDTRNFWSGNQPSIREIQK